MSAASEAPPLLRVRGLCKAHETPQGGGDAGDKGRLSVLDGADLDLAAGETLALMGESGSGKSTLLHLIAGLDRADAGDILLDGRDLGAMDDAARARLRRAEIGLVFQQFNLIGSLSVAANLAFQARLAGRFDRAWHEALLARLGLLEAAARWPEQLSGGQQQRLAIGRALAVRPRLLLADEPTGNLDERTADAVLDLMLELAADTGCAVLMATHSARLAARLDRCAVLHAGRIA